MRQESGDQIRPGDLLDSRPDRGAGSGPEARPERPEPAGVAVLEDNKREIVVAAYAGDRYAKAGEMARVRIELPPQGGRPVGRVVELRESPAARGSATLEEALAQAECMTYERGMRRLDCHIPPEELARCDPAERAAMVRALAQRGYTFREAPQEAAAPVAGGAARQVERLARAGSLPSLEAMKDLQERRPEPPRPAARPRPLEAERAVETPVAERDLEVEAPPGVAVLENGADAIVVATYAGERYSLGGESARVRLELCEQGRVGVAEIAEMRESEHARGTGELERAVAVAEDLAAKKGIKLVRFARSEREAPASSEARAELIRQLRRAGYFPTYLTDLPSGERRRVSEHGESVDGDAVVGAPVAIDALRDLSIPTADLPPLVGPIYDATGRELCAELDQAAAGRLPEEIHLPDEVSAKLEELWQRSVKKEWWPFSPPVREYAATLVETGSADVAFRHVVRGGEGSVRPQPPASDEHLIGYVHTHPYADGLRDMTFSGQDFEAFLLDPKTRVFVVQSGEAVFTLVKTNATPVIAAAEVGTIQARVDMDFRLFAASISGLEPGAGPASMDTQKAALLANMSACEEYHIALYAGQVGRPLQRVFP